MLRNFAFLQHSKTEDTYHDENGARLPAQEENGALLPAQEENGALLPAQEENGALFDNPDTSSASADVDVLKRFSFVTDALSLVLRS
jgi:hypothetical protein